MRYDHDATTVDLKARRRARWRIAAYGAMLLLALLALTGIAAASP